MCWKPPSLSQLIISIFLFCLWHLTLSIQPSGGGYFDGDAQEGV